MRMFNVRISSVVTRHLLRFWIGATLAGDKVAQKPPGEDEDEAGEEGDEAGCQEVKPVALLEALLWADVVGRIRVWPGVAIRYMAISHS